MLKKEMNSVVHVILLMGLMFVLIQTLFSTNAPSRDEKDVASSSSSTNHRPTTTTSSSTTTRIKSSESKNNNNKSPQDLYVLISGCGSSGTTYVAEMLNVNGVEVGHDHAVERNGIVSNALVVNSVWVYNYSHPQFEYVREVIPVDEFDIVLHLVRHPLEAISSVLQKWKDWGKIWLHIETEFPSEFRHQEASLQLAMEYWVGWNQHVAEYATAGYRFRFEDVLKDNNVLLKVFNKTTARYPNNSTSLPVHPGKSGRVSTFTWEDLKRENMTLYSQIRDLSEEYGYKEMND